MPQETTNFTPRFRTLAEELMQRFRSGEFPDGALLPSERELGLEYSLSRQTIRNALEIVAEKGWVVSRAGKGRFFQQNPGQDQNSGPSGPPRTATKQIGLICRTSTLFEDMSAGHPLLGLKSALSERGYSLSMSVASKDMKHRLHPLYPRWLKEDMMDGYILLSAPPHVQERLARESKPTVSLGYLWTDADIPSVEMDFRQIYRRAITYLGERDLLPATNFVAKEKTAEETKFISECLGGYRQGVRELALGSTQSKVVRYHDSAYDLVAAVRRAFKKGARPRSLILGSGRFLEDILQFLDKHQFSIPRDVFVLLIDSSNAPASCLSRVGYFESDSISMARHAGEKLLEMIATGDTQPRHERLDAGRFVAPVFENI